MKLVTKYRCRDQSVFRRYWHCLFRKRCGQLKPVLFKLLQDLFCFLKLCQSLFQPIFRRAGICWHNFKEFLTSSSSFVHTYLEVVSTWLPPQPGQHWARVFPGWTHWDFWQVCCILLLFSNQLKTYIFILSFVTVLMCVSVHAQRSSQYYVGIVLERRSEVLC